MRHTIFPWKQRSTFNSPLFSLCSHVLFHFHFSFETGFEFVFCVRWRRRLCFVCNFIKQKINILNIHLWFWFNVGSASQFNTSLFDMCAFSPPSSCLSVWRRLVDVRYWRDGNTPTADSGKPIFNLYRPCVKAGRLTKLLDFPRIFN